MKKFLFAAAVVVFASCGSGSNSTNYSDSASAAPPDTTSAVTAPVPDTAKLLKDKNHVLGDTTNMKDTPMLR